MSEGARNEEEPRYRCHWPVRLKVNALSRTGTIHNVSASGLFVETTTEAPREPQVELEITLPSGASMSARGRVVQHAWPLPAHGFGLELTELGDRKAWLNALETLRTTQALRSSDLFEVLVES